MKRQMVSILIMLALFLSVLYIPPSIEVAAKSKKKIYSEIAEQFLKRKKNFRITCSYDKTVQSIVDRINSNSDSRYYSALHDITCQSDRSNTTDDGEYLYGILEQVYCYYASGSLHFYDVKYFETKEQTKIVNRFTHELVKEIEKECSSRYKKIMCAYAFVIEQITYDTRKNCRFSAYAGYVKGKTVCNGYALMLYKILMEMGIPAKFVSGKLKDGKKWYPHAWNMVKYAGKWYNLDACSDDGDDGEFYADFFMKTDKQLSKTHRKDRFY